MSTEVGCEMIPASPETSRKSSTLFEFRSCGFAYEWPTIIPSVSTEGDPAPTIPSPSESVNPASITSKQPSPSESRSR